MDVRRLWEQVEGLKADLAAVNEERTRLRRALTKQGKQLTEITSLLSAASDERKELFARLEGVPPLPTDLPDRPAATLSVGQRQRLNLALAFLGSPRLLLLDEPTASLDPVRRQELWERLDGLCAGGGAVCFVTQDLEEVRRADRVGRVEDGRLALR